MGMDDLLKKATKSPAKKKATDVPDFPQTLPEVDELKKLLLELADLEAQEKTVGRKIKDVVGAFHRDLAKKGNYTTSVRASGPEGGQVLISWKHAYSKIPPDAEDALRSILGDKYDRFFGKKVEIVFQFPDSPAQFEEFIKVLGGGDLDKGGELFLKYFKVDQVIAPKPEFTERRHVEFSDETNKQLDATGVKQYDSAIKLEA